MTPLEILVTSLAYVMVGDGDVSAEERAKLLAVINKHVKSKEIMPAHLKRLVAASFDHARKIDLDRFLATAAPELTAGQRLAIFSNLYDMALADGEVMSGEKTILDRFQGAFDIDTNQVRAVQEVIMIKNDTRIFTNLGHPANDPKYKIKVFYQRE